MSLWCRGEYPIDEQCHVCPQRKACMSMCTFWFPIEVWNFIGRIEYAERLRQGAKAFAWECKVKK